MATISVPLVEGGFRSIDTDNLTAVGAMTADELRAAGVAQGTSIETNDAGDIVNTHTTMSVQDVLTAIFAEQSKEQLDGITGVTAAADITAAGAQANLAGITKTVDRAATYIILATGYVGTSVAATGGAVAQLAIGGVAAGVQPEWAAGCFIANSKPERALCIVHTATLAAAAVVTLQGGSSGVGDAHFYGVQLTLIPLG